MCVGRVARGIDAGNHGLNVFTVGTETGEVGGRARCHAHRADHTCCLPELVVFLKESAYPTCRESESLCKGAPEGSEDDDNSCNGFHVERRRVSRSDDGKK